MYINILERTENELAISFKGIDISHANLLRRIMISDIPTYAIEHTIVHKNTSYMNSEPLSARLALLPIRYTSINDTEIKLNLKVDCTERKEMSVYSSDITVSDTKLDIIHSNIPIMKLREGQCIDIELYCKSGTGKIHSKFSPVSVVDLLNRGTDIYMRIESTGQLGALEILIKSIEILESRNNDLLSQLNNIAF